MNILLIGNGFDIAHELPTTYTDFLKFVEVMKQIVDGKTDERIINWKNINYRIREQISNILQHNPNKILLKKEGWINLISENCWIEYFLQCQSYIGEDWIDFESEISKVVEEFDSNLKGIDLNENAQRAYIPTEFIKDFFIEDVEQKRDDVRVEFMKEFEANNSGASIPERCRQMKEYEKLHAIDDPQPITYKEILKRLEDDLNKLIHALEIYIADYVDNLTIEHKSPDIIRLLSESQEYYRLDKFISFNYSHTLKNAYGVDVQETDNGSNIDFIHGEARTDIDGNNMILGINEYLKGKEKNKNLLFVAYKKYYQRIYKKTGNQSKCWADRIRKDLSTYRNAVKEAKIKSRTQDVNRGSIEEMYGYVRLPKNITYETHYLYIFGHSLDVTDKDILKSLILNDNVQTTIFYHSEEAHAKYIANLVKIIGQNEMIKRT